MSGSPTPARAIRPVLLALMLVAVTLLSACGNTARATPKPVPTPFIPFPGGDTAFSVATGSQKEIWGAYEVATIPGQHTLLGVPAAPVVLDATNNVVPQDVAQQWGDAFYRDAGWRKWALAHAQTTFLHHIDGPADESFELQQGMTQDIPDCALYPSALALLELAPDVNGQVRGANQFLFQATYSPPKGGTCDVEFKNPDGHLSQSYVFNSPRVVADIGAVRDDPLLGLIWVTDNRTPCSYQCVDAPVANTRPAPVLPDAATLIASAPAPLQLAWRSYGVELIPAKGVLFGIPKAPKVDNQTHGVLSDKVAQKWGTDVIQQLTWENWAQEHIQTVFEGHIGDRSAITPEISGAAQTGGVPSLPTCALYPTGMAVSIISDDDRHSQAQEATHRDEFVFDLKYSNPCSVHVTFPDGKTDDLPYPKEIYSYGSVHQDPFLGEIWFPDAVINPTSFG